MDLLEERGVVGPKGSALRGSREVLLQASDEPSDQQEEEAAQEAPAS
jgi:hypothetical protein